MTYNFGVIGYYFRLAVASHPLCVPYYENLSY